MLLNKGSLSRRAMLLAGGCCSSLLIASVPTAAFAQDTTAQQNPPADETPADTAPTPGNPNPIDQQQPEVQQQQNGTIIVTGIRRGIASSINTKRNSQSIVEAVSAEDIGKLPDISIAESIARLPGLAAQRVGGRAQSISIRGLAPDFTTTLLNGRQQASSGDNRAVEFDQYPSELLSSVVIYKTPDANIAGFGLSGTADLRTVRPLEFGKRAIALNLRGEVNTSDRLNADVKKWGWRGTASYIDKLTPELGVALGIAYIDSPSQTRHTSVYGYEQFCPGGEDWCLFLRDQISPDGADLAYFPTGQEVFAKSKTNKRLGALGIVEWQPSDRVHTIVDLYYSRFKQRETMRGAQWFDNLWADNTNYTNVVTEDRGGTLVAVAGTATNITPQLRNDYNTRDDWLFSAGLNNEFKLNDELKFIGDLSYSRNKRNETLIETYSGYRDPLNPIARPNDDNSIPNRAFDTISWDVRDSVDSQDFPQYSELLNYADANHVTLGDNAPWTGWGHDGLKKSPHIKEQIYAADGGFRYQPTGSSIEAIDVGANFTRRDKKKRVDELDMFLKNDRLQVLVDSDLLVDPTSLDFAGVGDVIAVKMPGGTLDRYYDYRELEDANHFDKSWKIKEDVLTLKARAQFALGNLHGNIGFQGVHQKQHSSGQRIDISTTPIVISQVSDGKSYWDWLPSLNAFYDFGGGHRLRFAAAKVMARPRMDELRANLTPYFSNPCLSGEPCQPGSTIHPWAASGGNPLLEPWRAKAVDLSYEWYIGPASYIAVAGFYKKLDSYIYTQHLAYDFSGLPLPSTANGIPVGVIIDPMGTIDQPANGKGGNVRGIELSGALELGRITKFLDGFGVLGSYSKTKSNLKTKNTYDDPAAPPAARIPGLSGTVYNLTGYYEKYGFQARMSYRYRSKFKGEVLGLYTVRTFSEILADKQVDAQVGYTFPEGTRFQNLGFLLQVYNLTDAPYRTRFGLDTSGVTATGTTFGEQYEKYGRQVLFGVNYRF